MAHPSLKIPIKHLCTIYEGHKRTIYGVAFNPYSVNTSFFATVGENRATVYAIPKEGCGLKLLRNYQDSAKGEAFFCICWAYDIDSDSHAVVVGGVRGIIRVIDISENKLANSLIGHGDAVNDVRVCPNDSMIIASASKDFTARIWNIRNSACLAILGGVEGHLDQVISIDFDVTSEYLASASMDHTIKLWYIGKDSSVQRMIDQSYDDLKLVDSPAEIHCPRCSTRDIHANYVDCVRIFHSLIFSKCIESERCLKDRQHHGEAKWYEKGKTTNIMRHVSIQPSTEDEIVLWKFGDMIDSLVGLGSKIKTEGCVTHLSHLLLPEAYMWFIRFEIDPLERYLVCGNQSGELHVWELRKDVIPKRESDYVVSIKDVKCTIRHVSFSPCGEHMIAVADDASISRFSVQKCLKINTKL